MRFKLTLLILGIPSWCFSQILLSSGQEYDYSKFKSKPDHLEVKSKGDKSIIGIDSVKGYYALVATGREIVLFKSTGRYLRQKLDLTEPIDELPYAFAALVSPGEIEIFMKLEYRTGYNNTPYTVTYLYLKKGELTYHISDKDIETKKTIIKNLTNNDPKILKLLDDQNLTFSDKEIIDLVKKYNVTKHKNLAKPSDKKGKITVYRMKNGELKQPLPMKIDENEYSIDLFEVKVVEISSVNPVKLCIGTDPKMYCEILIGTDDYIPYYEVRMNKKGEVKLLPTTDKKAINAIQYFRGKNR